MILEKLELGVLRANCYILKKEDSCLIIDPGDEPEKILTHVKDLKIVAVLLTHGHFDHMMGVKGLLEKTKAPLYLQKESFEEYLNAGNLSFVIGVSLDKPVSPDFVLKNGLNNIGPFEFEVISTPGHTPGSVCFLFDKDLFAGDTLFEGTHGRTDLFGSSHSKMKESLSKLADLDPDINVYPGHGNSTTIKKESIWMKII
jgi:glyoxylase-like metal-dependent hydrolase (beta-lactamase superfamily II)